MSRNRFAGMLPVPTHTPGPANKYDPEYCWTVRKMGQEGQFPEEWCAEIGVTMWTLYNWANTYPEFEQAMHEAWYCLRAYWAKQARIAAQGGSGVVSPTVMLEILRKRFPDTWGLNPKATHDHFIARNDVDLEQGAAPAGAIDKPPEAHTDDELQRKIAEMEARRKAAQGQ